MKDYILPASQINVECNLKQSQNMVQLCLLHLQKRSKDFSGFEPSLPRQKTRKSITRPSGRFKSSLHKEIFKIGQNQANLSFPD